MSLTFSNGPLGPNAPDTTNYTIDGPQHKLLMTPFPRRVRGLFAGETLVDTDRGMLLYESNVAPALYVPLDDINTSLLTKTGLSTHCPFKGDASYWTIMVGAQTAESAVWGYETPLPEAAWLQGYVAMYWDRIDQWFDEDEEIFGHLRDPYHRVDVRPSSRTVQVSIGDQIVAESDNAMVLSETGIPNRFYIPAEGVKTELFESSTTTSHCPHKGDAQYWSLAGAAPASDVAWGYTSPLDE